MAENDVNVLMSVDLDGTEALKTLATLRTETAELRKEQKELDRTTAEGAVEYERLGTQIKANTKSIQQYERQIVNAIKQENASKDSIDAKRAALSNAKRAYDSLSAAERDSSAGKALLQQTAELNAELKVLEGSYGDNQRLVGTYENAGKSLRTEMRGLVQTLTELKVAGKDNSAEYSEMAARLADLRDAMGDVNQQATQQASDTATFDAMAQGVQAVMASYGTWKSISAATGVENEALDKTMRDLTIVMAALQSLTTLQNLSQKQSNLYRVASNILQKIGIKQTTAEAVATSANVAAVEAEVAAEGASAAAKTKGVVVTKLITAAQWLWNSAVSANPVMLLVVSVAALIAGITGLVGWMNRDTAAAKESQAAQEALNRTLEDGERIREEITRKESKALNDRSIAAREEILQLRKNGATAKAIAEAQAAADTDMTNTKLKASRVRVDQMEYELNVLNVTIAAQEREQRTTRASSKAFEELSAKLQESIDKRATLIASLADEGAAVENLSLDLEEQSRNRADADKAAAKEAAEAARSRTDSIITAFEVEIEAQRTAAEARLKAEAGYQSDDLSVRQAYARKIFGLEQSAERARLDNLLKFRRISEKEYSRSLGLMSAQLTEFANGQSAELRNFVISEQQSILDLLTQTTDEQIADVERQYNYAIGRLSKLEPPEILPGEDEAIFAKRLADYEKFALDQVNIALRLEKERDAKVKSIQTASTASVLKDIGDLFQAAYDDDLTKFSDNENKKLEITEKMLREQIAAKQAAGLNAFEDEAKLRATLLQQNALDLNRDLLLAGDSAKKKYDAKVKALEAERELSQGNADAQLEIDKELADAEQELTNARVSHVQTWANAASELFGSINDLISANVDQELAHIQATYDAEKIALADKYANGLLTEAQYNKEQIKLD